MTNLPKTESEWRAVLSPEQFRVLREKGTERAGTGAYRDHKERGVYTCAGCDAPLYTSASKFDSGCGWPAFFEAVPDAIERHEDRSFGMVRRATDAAPCRDHLQELRRAPGPRLPRRGLSHADGRAPLRELSVAELVRRRDSRSRKEQAKA